MGKKLVGLHKDGKSGGARRMRKRNFLDSLGRGGNLHSPLRGGGGAGQHRRGIIVLCNRRGGGKGGEGSSEIIETQEKRKKSTEEGERVLPCWKGPGKEGKSPVDGGLPSGSGGGQIKTREVLVTGGSCPSPSGGLHIPRKKKRKGTGKKCYTNSKPSKKEGYGKM